MDFENLRLYSVNFSTTVVRAAILHYYGDMAFNLPKVSRISYVLSAVVIKCSGVMTSQ